MASAIQVGDLAADGHHLAVDEPGVLGPQLAGEHGQHGLVQEGEALVEVAAANGHGPLAQQPEGGQRRGTEAASKVLDVPGGGEGGVEVAALERLVEVEPAQEPMALAFGPPGEEASGAADPRRAESGLAAQEPGEADVQGVRCRPIHAALVEKPPVALLAQRQRLASPGPVVRGAA
jgi:hypothetical protein